MSMLRQIQADFERAILGEPGAQEAMAAHVYAQCGLGAAERVAIYRTAYRMRMRASLAAAFPSTLALAGEVLFAVLADSYVAAHRSPHANLRWYGEDFGPFVARSQPGLAWIGELAALEWALGLAFDAPDAEVISLADLSQLAPAAWGGLAFSLHPAVRVLTLATNAGALWQTMSDAQDAQDAPAGALLAAPQAWLVWRPGHQPHLRALDAAEAQALRALAAGASFGHLCAAAPDGGVAPAQRMAGYLQGWLSDGLLSSLISTAR